MSPRKKESTVTPNYKKLDIAEKVLNSKELIVKNSRNELNDIFDPQTAIIIQILSNFIRVQKKTNELLRMEITALKRQLEELQIDIQDSR